MPRPIIEITDALNVFDDDGLRCPSCGATDAGIPQAFFFVRTEADRGDVFMRGGELVLHSREVDSEDFYLVCIACSTELDVPEGQQVDNY